MAGEIADVVLGEGLGVLIVETMMEALGEAHMELYPDQVYDNNSEDAPLPELAQTDAEVGAAENEQTDDFNPEARCKSVDQATAELLQQLQEEEASMNTMMVRIHVC